MELNQQLCFKNNLLFPFDNSAGRSGATALTAIQSHLCVTLIAYIYGDILIHFVTHLLAVDNNPIDFTRD